MCAPSLYAHVWLCAPFLCAHVWLCAPSLCAHVWLCAAALCACVWLCAPSLCAHVWLCAPSLYAHVWLCAPSLCAHVWLCVPSLCAHVWCVCPIFVRSRAVVCLSLCAHVCCVPHPCAPICGCVLSEGLREKDKNQITSVLHSVGVLNHKDQAYSLAKHLYGSVRLDWPEYRQEDVTRLKRLVI